MTEDRAQLLSLSVRKPNRPALSTQYRDGNLRVADPRFAYGRLSPAELFLRRAQRGLLRFAGEPMAQHVGGHQHLHFPVCLLSATAPAGQAERGLDAPGAIDVGSEGFPHVFRDASRHGVASGDLPTLDRLTK